MDGNKGPRGLTQNFIARPRAFMDRPLEADPLHSMSIHVRSGKFLKPSSSKMGRIFIQRIAKLQKSYDAPSLIKFGDKRSEFWHTAGFSNQGSLRCEAETVRECLSNMRRPDRFCQACPLGNGIQSVEIVFGKKYGVMECFLTGSPAANYKAIPRFASR